MAVASRLLCAIGILLVVQLAAAAQNHEKSELILAKLTPSSYEELILAGG